MSYWVGVDDNLNNGWPKVINAISKPVQYLRVLGPYDTEDDATDAAFNYPDVTAGWRAVCQFYTAPGKGNTIHLDYPPNGQQYPVFYGPYDTQALAQTKADTLACQYVTAPAIDICSSEPKYSIPPTLRCSLVCSALQWPQQSGTIIVSFYRRTCLPGDPDRSIHFPAMYSIGLGCPVGAEDTPVTGWVGRSSVTDIVLLNTPYNMGYTVRFAGTMGVLTANKISVSVNIERLFAGVDIDPINPPPNQWGSCGGFSGLAYRVVPPGVDPADRTVTRTYVSDLIEFVPSCFSDVHYAQVSVILLPMKFECDGTANGGQQSRCGLTTLNSSYSCFTAYIRPLKSDGILPHTVQLGLNDTGSTGNGCFEGSYDALGLPTITPAYAEESAMALLQAGHPDEAVALLQKIQLGSVSNFQVMVKNVNKGGLYVGVRSGTGGTWTFQPFTDTSVMSAVPLCHKFTFTNILSNTGITTDIELYLYGLRFPPVEIQDCMGDSTDPGGGAGDETPEADSPTLRPADEPMPTPVATMIASYNDRYPRKCIHLGPVIRQSCCGAPSLHECKLGLGNCRPAGAAWTDEEISCRGCTSFKSAVE